MCQVLWCRAQDVFSILHAGIMYSATPNIVQSKLAMSDGIFFLYRGGLLIGGLLIGIEFL